MDKEKAIEAARALVKEIENPPYGKYRDPCWRNVDELEEFKSLKEALEDKPSNEDLIACLERLHFDTEQSRVNYKHLNDKKRTWTLTRYINYNFKYEELVKKTIKENVKPECLIKAARGI